MEVAMLKSTAFQIVAVLETGMLLGYGAATGNLWNHSADASLTSGQAMPSVPADSLVSLPQHDAASEPCCMKGSSKELLLAAAETTPIQTVAFQRNGGGKKPNIVFIMGDDVGWF